MAKAQATKTIKVLRVASTREGFRRAGFSFTREPQDLPLADLKKEQIEAIKGDPSLIAVETEAEIAATAEVAAE